MLKSSHYVKIQWICFPKIKEQQHFIKRSTLFVIPCTEHNYTIENFDGKRRCLLDCTGAIADLGFIYSNWTNESLSHILFQILDHCPI